MNTKTTYTAEQMALIEKYRDANVDHDWWTSTFDVFIAVAKAFGIDTSSDEIQFSGFWSQGDGASFTFSTVSANDILQAGIAVEQENPYGDGPHEGYVAEFYALYQLIFDVFATTALTSPEGAKVADNYNIEAERISRQYSHERTVRVLVAHDFDDEDIALFPALKERLEHDTGSPDPVAKELDGCIERIAKALYRTLEVEHDYLTSDDVVWESIVANGWDRDRVAA